MGKIIVILVSLILAVAIFMLVIWLVVATLQWLGVDI
jgi:hypothetical protein